MHPAGGASVVLPVVVAKVIVKTMPQEIAEPAMAKVGATPGCLANGEAVLLIAGAPSVIQNFSGK
jgi:hypothetical protein